MSKFLTNNEINVLQENLDLFGSATEGRASISSSTPKAKAERTTQTTKQRPPHKKAHTAKTETAKPDLQQSIDLLIELPTDQKPEISPTTVNPLPSTANAKIKATTKVKAKAEVGPEIPIKTIEAVKAKPATQHLTPQQERASTEKTQEGRTKYLAVRAPSPTAAKEALQNKGAQVINYSMEKRDPALRNLFEALLDSGLEYRIENLTVHWLLIEDDQSTTQHTSNNSVELAFCSNWFEQQKARIRRLRGVDYIDACAEIAQQLQLKSQVRSITEYRPGA